MPGPALVGWMDRMNTNTQGQQNNWTAVDGLDQREIILQNNPGIAGWYPPGTTTLNAWLWIRQLTDLHDDMGPGATIGTGPTDTPRCYVSFHTGHKDDPFRKCQTIAGISHASVEANSGAMQHEEGEYLIPVDSRGSWNSSTQSYDYDGLDRVYVDMFSWNLGAVLNSSWIPTGSETIPSFVKIRVDGWAT